MSIPDGVASFFLDHRPSIDGGNGGASVLASIARPLGVEGQACASRASAMLLTRVWTARSAVSVQDLLRRSGHGIRSETVSQSLTIYDICLFADTSVLVGRQ